MVDGVNRINPVSSTGLYKVYAVDINTPNRNQNASMSSKIDKKGPAKDPNLAAGLAAQKTEKDDKDNNGRSAAVLIGGVDKNTASERAAKQSGQKECKT